MQKLSQRPGDNFSEKYKSYGNMLFRICMVYLGNKEDAEEALQESFIKLIYRSPQFMDSEHEKAWIIRITANICKDMLRNIWRKRVVKMEDIEHYYDNPSDTHVMEEILKLPAKYKAAIYLYYFEDYSVKNISKTLGIGCKNAFETGPRHIENRIGRRAVMNKSDIKRVICKLEPDMGMEHRLSEKIQQNHSKKLVLRPVVSIAAGLLMVISLGFLGYHLMDKEPGTSINIKNSENIANSEGGIYIPKIELPKNQDPAVEMDMIGLIVYQSRIFTQTGTRISPDTAEKLIDEKLGTTKGGIDEWSKQDDYAVEFASTVGVKDVYSVKGYDKSFRIMALAKENGTVLDAQFYECLNGITVKIGADVFDKLKIENNAKKVRFQNFESWNNGRQEFKELEKTQFLDGFISELKNTIPFKQESLSYLFKGGDTSQKFIYITLNDGSEVQLRLFKGGYVYYGYSHIFFKMENEFFNLFWNEIA